MKDMDEAGGAVAGAMDRRIMTEVAMTKSTTGMDHLMMTIMAMGGAGEAEEEDIMRT